MDDLDWVLGRGVVAVTQLKKRRRHDSERYFVDLFAGCGGLSLGLEQAGFSPVFVSELNQDALDTYLVNRENRYPHLLEEDLHCNDVNNLLEDDYVERLHKTFESTFGLGKGQLDLVVGGPPCQGYSMIGHRRSHSVDKEHLPYNRLYESMAGVIERFQPKMFLFENVAGLLSARWSEGGEKGAIWKDVISRFESIPGYVVQSSVLMAGSYGVPQKRQRVFIVGIRGDLGYQPEIDGIAGGLLPRPLNDIRDAPTIPEVLGDLVDPEYTEGLKTCTYPSRKPSRFGTESIVSKLRLDEQGNIPRKGDPLTEHEYSKHSPKIRNKFQYMIDNHGEIRDSDRTNKFAQRLLPTSWKASGPTVTVTSLPDDYVHWSQPRSLTVREWARLQTFPDWYQFKGSRTTGGARRAGNPRELQFHRELPRYTQIGNAVPVLMATAIGEHFNKLLGKVSRPKRVRK